MSVTLGILGAHPNITITVPCNTQLDGDNPTRVMIAARRRFASYGAERVTLIPHRSGEGWTQKQKKEN